MKQQLNNEITGMNILDYFEHFDKAFNCNISDTMKNTKYTMLEEMWQCMGENIYFPSAEHNRLREKRSQISNKILSTYSFEEEQLFSDYWELEEEIASDINKQMLIFRYCIAYKQLQEMGALKD